MKTQIALLGFLLLAWNVAIAGVDCARAPYGESVAQYGRDEFHLGIIAAMHGGNHRSLLPSTSQEIHRAMRAACRAKFYGEDLSRYGKLGLPPHRLARESVGSIAAVALDWNGPRRRGGGNAAPPSSTVTVSHSAPAERPTVSRAAHDSSSLAHVHYAMVTADVPACPRRVDLKRFLTAALINTAAWPQAEAVGKRHGCIELHAGDRVYRVRTDFWGGVTQVKREGHTKAYWTDSMVVK